MNLRLRLMVVFFVGMLFAGYARLPMQQPVPLQTNEATQNSGVVSSQTPLYRSAVDAQSPIAVVNIYAGDTFIGVRTSHRVNVEIYTVLGQLVTQGVAEPPLAEFSVKPQNIYLVKIGDVTKKVML